jgi:hypothetical protein
MVIVKEAEEGPAEKSREINRNLDVDRAMQSMREPRGGGRRVFERLGCPSGAYRLVIARRDNRRNPTGIIAWI